jgi:hypothetical protein
MGYSQAQLKLLVRLSNPRKRGTITVQAPEEPLPLVRTFRPGDTSWLIERTGYYDVIAWGPGGLASSDGASAKATGGAGGVAVKLRRRLIAGQSVTMSVGTTGNTTVDLPGDATQLVAEKGGDSSGGTVAGVGGGGSGGDVVVTGTSGGTATNPANPTVPNGSDYDGFRGGKGGAWSSVTSSDSTDPGAGQAFPASPSFGGSAHRPVGQVVIKQVR